MFSWLLLVGYTAPDVNSLAQAIACEDCGCPVWVLIAAIVVLAVGSVSVVVGYKARFGAFALLLFLVLIPTGLTASRSGMSSMGRPDTITSSIRS